MTIRLLLVGCGNMGHAMLAGWMKMADAPEVVVVEPAAPLRERAEATGALAVADHSGIPEGFAPDVTILAVKPQMMEQVLPGYARFRDGCFVSIAAGTTMAALARGLGEAAIVRCMPNTPAAIGRGVFGFTANAAVTAEQRALVRRLLEPSGRVFELDDETMIDRITAVSGSGPAYLFHFIEALADAARAIGLPDDVATEAARQTVFGAAALAEAAPEDAAALRRAVTSPGGTTAAALDVLMGEDRLTRLMTEAVRAAFARAEELGKQ
ncbi:pyrroline-5-carboxylate reductase [Amaricoccus solimangrovi]|uniref:Pyrroline-5-carboxylate reductase n=1 Tax=Amaricoccus solimangrovi TaxID=2589815 RepID=A0A501WY90_9RHOB|nr:pyrroline-5-carboxylate reductase [Amaricoccus solimangrovi]TPE53712.1 pyrroline-5-carboxylate reductase [Amaricoccus solimangrovi]